MVPGVVIWGSIILMLVLAMLDMRWYFVVMLPNSLFGLYMALKMAIYGRIGMNKVEMCEKRKFKEEFDEFASNNANVVNWDDILHYIIIANYNEHVSTIQDTLDCIGKSAIAKTNLIVVLAMEEAETECKAKAEQLIEDNKHQFKQIIYSVHPRYLKGEQAGKSSNASWAAFKIRDHVESHGYPEDKVLITLCDSDSMFHSKYFEHVTFQFCTDKHRHLSVYQPPMMCLRNYHETYGFTKGMSLLVSLHELACLVDPHDHVIPFSTFTMSYELASSVGGWDGDVIADDWHMYFKLVFATKCKVKVEPIFLPVSCYAVSNDESIVKAFMDRFEQGVLRLCFNMLQQKDILGVFLNCHTFSTS